RTTSWTRCLGLYRFRETVFKMADNYEGLNLENEEIFGPEAKSNSILESWTFLSALKAISGLVLAIGFLPIVLWYVQSSTILVPFDSILFIWTGIVLWGFWYYLERRYDRKTRQ
ncbi:MAG: hypothetical protein P1Q69_10010, partial [Candidatus Thorarchaeota archaeon]|nr:hypothetical protein [Candidatus Thorarchaeota archaeon]